ncbi:hypothetical protein QJS04_geneDACA022003 [Acorus gramineus]|uniref:Aminotransferase-like plant mobile domain-containing protein n=1 Tax=Acorus gramineus TaxID=55184 RepID=A0AAV9A0V2_ACOGR|nr:hypothetical protein QJS04_geneDACA022003 [Acorus gramineus]
MGWDDICEEIEVNNEEEEDQEGGEEEEEVGEDTEEEAEDREDHWVEGPDTEEDHDLETVAIHEYSVPHDLMEQAVAENVHPCIYDIGSSSCNELEGSHRSHHGFQGKTDSSKFMIHMVALRHWVMDPRIEPYIRSRVKEFFSRGLKKPSASYQMLNWMTISFRSMHLWSWERLHVRRPPLHDPDFVLGDRPLRARWKVTQRFDENSSVLIYYRAQLDYQLQSQVIWQPYARTYETLPPACMDHMELWMARVPLICFDIVEMHVPDRVARQFGWHQDIPSDVEDVDRVNR